MATTSSSAVSVRGHRGLGAMFLGYVFASFAPQAAYGRQQLPLRSGPAQGASFLQAEAEVVTVARTGARVTQRSKEKAHPAEFFDSFSQGESTYDEEADFGRIGRMSRYQDGYEPSIKNKYEKNTMKSAWFHESPSGGPDVAWQTHYPTAPGDATWKKGAAGGWNQDYVRDDQIGMKPTDGHWMDIKWGAGKLPAAYFDNGVQQYDVWGRHTLPSVASANRYYSWKERSVNTTMKCSEPGCIANTTLYAFHGMIERARNCRLTVYVKPTDFDEQYSGEQVDWIQVNGVNVSVACKPLASGCNATAQQPLFPCATNVLLDNTIVGTGTLNISAKIPTSVDECPYDGSLLYAIPTVTCQTADLVPLPKYAPIDENGMFLSVENGTLNATVPLKCKEAGCLANALVKLNNHGEFNLSQSSCSMDVLVNATDFDNTDWSTPQETIEFINIGSGSPDITFSTLANDTNLGKNPCKAKWNGTALEPADYQNIKVVSNHDVTKEMQNGTFIVLGKISDHVDECASQGNLLDAMVKISCVEKKTAILQVAAAPAETPPAAADATPVAEAAEVVPEAPAPEVAAEVPPAAEEALPPAEAPVAAAEEQYQPQQQPAYQQEQYQPPQQQQLPYQQQV